MSDETTILCARERSTLRRRVFAATLCVSGGLCLAVAGIAGPVSRGDVRASAADRRRGAQVVGLRQRRSRPDTRGPLHRSQLGSAAADVERTAIGMRLPINHDENTPDPSGRMRQHRRTLEHGRSSWSRGQGSSLRHERPGSSDAHLYAAGRGSVARTRAGGTLPYPRRSCGSRCARTPS